jgi:hypothetical protein
MSAEMIGPAADPRVNAPRRPGRDLRRVVGVLADGTACYAPAGEVVVEGSLVTCHLCGRSFRSVAAHLASHRWTKQQYCEAFGLERGQSLEGPETRKLRAAAFTARMHFEPAVRQGSAAGHTPPSAIRRRSVRPTSPPAWVTPISRPTSATADPVAGHGRQSPPSPVSPKPGCAGTQRHLTTSRAHARWADRWRASSSPTTPVTCSPIRCP